MHPGMSSSQNHKTAHYGAVTGLRTTTDGMHLLSSGSDSRLRLWDVDSGCNTLVNFEAMRLQTSKPLQLAVTDDPSLVFIPCMSSIKAYNTWSGTTFQTFRGHYDHVNCCYYNSQDQELYTGSNDRQILVWSPSTPALTEMSTMLELSSASRKSRCSPETLTQFWCPLYWYDEHCYTISAPTKPQSVRGTRQVGGSSGLPVLVVLVAPELSDSLHIVDAIRSGLNVAEFAAVARRNTWLRGSLIGLRGLRPARRRLVEESGNTSFFASGFSPGSSYGFSLSSGTLRCSSAPFAFSVESACCRSAVL
ncbi:hypothetical protein ZWY2020_018223 [Hordeum vulgare]|nr:hypothetical protein ZWY2020_018223 [Hordeum vulgare]